MKNSSKSFTKLNFAKFIKSEIEEEYSGDFENIDFTFSTYSNFLGDSNNSKILEKLNIKSVSNCIFKFLEISLEEQKSIAYSSEEFENRIFKILESLSISEVLYISTYLAINSKKLISEFSELKELVFLIETIFKFIKLNYSKDILETLDNESKHEIISFIYASYLTINQSGELITNDYELLTSWINLLKDSLEINLKISYVDLINKFFPTISLKFESLETSILLLQCSIEKLEENFNFSEFLKIHLILDQSIEGSLINFIHAFMVELENSKTMEC